MERESARQGARNVCPRLSVSDGVLQTRWRGRAMALLGRLAPGRKKVDAVKSGYIMLRVVIKPEDGQFTARVPALDIASCGETLQDAATMIQDAIMLYLRTLDEDGELLQELEARGITVLDRAEDLQVDEAVAPGTYVTTLAAPVSPHLAYA
jgi:predicted RNase H-like HicB family nuclease